MSTTAQSEIDISVLLITYNHERYVGAAIQSVLAQQTSRHWELIVSEDASTDSTLEVVREAARDDPRVRYLLSDTNLHSNESVARAIRAARGRYVSMIDGDDFWIVDDKLERQATLLDGEPGASACFHNALVVEGGSMDPGERRWTPPGQPRATGIEGIWRGNPFATCAGMLRKNALVGLGDWYSKMTAMITDWPLYVLCAERGDLLFVDEPVGAYRLHPQGLFTGLSSRDQLAAIASLYRQLDAGLERRHHRAAISGATVFFTDRGEEHLQFAQRQLGRLCLWYALRAGGVGRAVSWGRWLRLAKRSVP